MDRIIPSKPAKYPSTNASESRAITVFKFILSEFVKSDIREMDKVPNSDGYLEITNENYEPTGKIEVQIKGISGGCSGEPKYQCSLKFLSYCESCILPVFLILVDTKSEVAYWIFISRELLKNLVLKLNPDSESISVKIPSNNIIRRGNADYLVEWQKIIEDYRMKICYYDPLLEEKTNIEKKYDTFKQEYNLVGIEKSEFKNIHKFLDNLNMYLDTDFSIIKDLYYNSCWKLGLAYGYYSEDKIKYLLYPINYFKNDLQIREISGKLKDELRNYDEISIYPNNPIHLQPENYAKELVIKKVTEICDKKLLPLSNMSLFREVIFGFIDNLHKCLGLKVKNSYTIYEIRHSFYTYLPIWVDEVLTNGNVNLGYHPLFKPYIDPGFLLTQLNREKKEEFDKKVNERIRNCQFNSRSLVLGTRDFPLKLISNFLESSFLNDFGEINRLYIPPNFKRPTNGSHSIWSYYSPEEVFENIKTFFNEFPDVYDATIDYCFPKLKKELKFFNDFDTLIVVIEVHDNYTNLNYCPSIEYYYLRNEDANSEKEIKVYMKGRDHIPINRKIDFQSNICIDGKSYTVKTGSSGMLTFIFERLPMFDFLYKTLRERMKNLFIIMGN
jgi:hypothetical protein